jgi:hypothetical protein
MADVHVADSAAPATQREQQVADFVTKKGAKAHAATLANGSRVEVAQAAHAAAGATLLAARKAIVVGEATNSSPAV